MMSDNNVMYHQLSIYDYEFLKENDFNHTETLLVLAKGLNVKPSQIETFSITNDLVKVILKDNKNNKEEKIMENKKELRVYERYVYVSVSKKSGKPFLWLKDKNDEKHFVTLVDRETNKRIANDTFKNTDKLKVEFNGYNINKENGNYTLFGVVVKERF